MCSVYFDNSPNVLDKLKILMNWKFLEDVTKEANDACDLLEIKDR